MAREIALGIPRGPAGGLTDSKPAPGRESVFVLRGGIIQAHGYVSCVVGLVRKKAKRIAGRLVFFLLSGMTRQ